MNEQGCSDYDAEVNERILDRIVGLEKIITPELVNLALSQTGKQVTRDCLLNNQVMIWVVLAMVCLPICRSGRYSKHAGECDMANTLRQGRAFAWHGNVR